MDNQIQTVKKLTEADLREIETQTVSVILVNTSFDISHKQKPVKAKYYSLSEKIKKTLTDAIEALEFGGLLFVYGLPFELPYIGNYLQDLTNEKQKILFKYWITLGVDQKTTDESFNAESMGMLMYLKSKPKNVSPFQLNTKTVRISYTSCTVCGENVKDWGGKKHLMNPLGTAISDVWRDLPKRKLIGDEIPLEILQRVYDLTVKDDAPLYYIKAAEKVLTVTTDLPETLAQVSDTGDWDRLEEIDANRVYQGDTVSFLNRGNEIYPEGLFNLAFADPPYNLQKEYTTYNDELADLHYIEWCNRWLDGMVRILKPGGSLFILNLPKWCIEHAVFLNDKMEFRNWITWDALSDPRGKIMPAHYGLLYYTKPGGENTLNIDEDLWEVTSPQYCLRQGCVKKRKAAGDDIKIQLTDIWSDIHRIKHKRDRDAHPCQLPEKLLERIIKLTTKKGDLVFDPFGGAGTTAIAAKKLERNYVITELDSQYAEIAKKNLAGMDRSYNLFGELIVPRESIKRPVKKFTKKSVEKALQSLTRTIGRIPTEEDIKKHDSELITQIDELYPSLGDALKPCRLVLREIKNAEATVS